MTCLAVNLELLDARHFVTYARRGLRRGRRKVGVGRVGWEKRQAGSYLALRNEVGQVTELKL